MLLRIAAEFIAEHWILDSRVAISRVEVSRGLKAAVIYVTVHPESQEKNALRELAAIGPKLYNDLAGKLKIKFTPRFVFRIDEGEKNREKVEELLRGLKN